MYLKQLVFIHIIYLALVNGGQNTGYGVPLSSYGTPNYDTNGHNHEYSEPKAYEFGYQVKDDYSGNNYKRQEISDGNQVKGEYRVQLPDGRTQIVTYYADWQTGFHADVRYEGTASYPENYGTNQGPSNQYGPPAVPSFNNYNSNPVHNAPATSSVTIKDYSSAATPYNVGNLGHNEYSNYDHGYQNQASFDNYRTSNLGNKISPVYGAL